MTICEVGSGPSMERHFLFYNFLYFFIKKSSKFYFGSWQNLYKVLMRC